MTERKREREREGKRGRKRLCREGVFLRPMPFDVPACSLGPCFISMLNNFTQFVGSFHPIRTKQRLSLHTVRDCASAVRWVSC